MDKGLAKLGNCLRHDLLVKYVDVSLFKGEERLLPNDGKNFMANTPARQSIEMREHIPL